MLMRFMHYLPMTRGDVQILKGSRKESLAMLVARIIWWYSYRVVQDLDRGKIYMTISVLFSAFLIIVALLEMIFGCYGCP